jgi:predicted nucleotidyltransferase
MEAVGRLPSPIRARLADLERLFRQAEHVVSAYLFGSVAEAVSNNQSDIDFAVRLEAGLSVQERHQIRMRLIQELEQVLEGDVDVVVLDDASLKMIHQVLIHGSAIHVENDQLEESFRLKKQKEFFDFQYYLDKESRDLRAFYDC